MTPPPAPETAPAPPPAPAPRRPAPTGIAVAVGVMVLVYAGFVLWEGAGEVWAAVRLPGWTGLAALALFTLLALSLGLARWWYYLRLVGVRVGVGAVLRAYLGSQALALTPGRVGELWRGWLLPAGAGPAGRVAATVVAERMTDVFATLLLAGAAAVLWTGSPWLCLVPGSVIVGSFVLLRRPGWALGLARVLARRRGWWWRGAADGLRSLAKARECLRPGGFLVGLAVGLGMQAAEGFGLLALLAAAGTELPLFRAVAGYGFALFVGSVTPAPGGAGGFEGTLTAVLVNGGVDEPLAVASALLVRIVTMWLMVPVGLAALWSPRPADTVPQVGA